MAALSTVRSKEIHHMTSLNILSIQRLSDNERTMIAAVDDSVNLTVAGGWFDGEIRDTWPEFAANRYLPAGSNGKGTKAERGKLLADADIIIGGWPFPFDLRTRATKMKWFHQQPAGASNLLKSDLWGSDVIVTTSRGYGNTLGIGEYVLASIFHFAKGFHVAPNDRDNCTFDFHAYKPLVVEGKTVCVIGAGGIGLDVGRRCAAAGMRVVGTRRTIEDGAPMPEGFSELKRPEHLDEFLPDADFVAVCCQWTPETENLLNVEAFKAMKPGSVVINVARGEIIDEDAMVDALVSGRLRGAALDVYVGEFDGPPDARLWEDPRVLITPHNSGATDIGNRRTIELFCRNLQAYMKGEPLENRLDWEKWY
jgi:phosphoglycerate dehydrogenase-like enzyme